MKPGNLFKSSANTGSVVKLDDEREELKNLCTLLIYSGGCFFL